MKKDLAAQFVNAVVSFDEGLGTLDILVAQIDDPDERKRYAKALGDLMRVLMMDFLVPIEAEYPDLNPDD